MAGPNPRDISNTVCAQDVLSGNSARLSDIMWQFGQFLDHDIDLTEFSVAFGNENIPIANPNDIFASNGCAAIHFDRSQHTGGDMDPRQQVNLISGGRLGGNSGVQA